MVALIAAWEAAPAAAVTAAVAYAPARRYQKRRRLARTRAHIAELERELGFDVPLDERLDRELAPFAQAVQTGTWTPQPYDVDKPFRVKPTRRRRSISDAFERRGWNP